MMKVPSIENKEKVALLWQKGKLVKEVTVKQFLPYLQIYEESPRRKFVAVDAPINPMSTVTLQKLTFRRASAPRHELFMVTCNYEFIGPDRARALGV